MILTSCLIIITGKLRSDICITLHFNLFLRRQKKKTIVQSTLFFDTKLTAIALLMSCEEHLSKGFLC